jgi:hypothetical protein
MSDDEFIKMMASKFDESKRKQDKLKPEYDMAEAAYQAISAPADHAGLDSGLATQALYSGKSMQQEMPMVEGLDLAKAVLFLHSKLCISDPIVQFMPRKQDPATKRAVECAQGYLPYMKQRMKLQETLESGPYLHLCIHGSGIVYNGWDVDGGEMPLDNFPEDPVALEQMLQKGFKMEGDYDLRNVHPRNFYPDASADHWQNCEDCFEKWSLPFEEAMYRFGGTDQQNILREYHKKFNDSAHNEADKSVNLIDLYIYTQRGRPWNGFLGAQSIFVNPEAPQLLTRKANPFTHKKLPYSVYTDVDIPNNVMGMSRIVYGYQAQLCINNILYLIHKNIALFGGNKMLLPEGAVNDDVVNNALEGVAYFNPTTGGKPEYIRPANVTTDVWRAYEIQRAYINNVYGMNEFSQGQIPRELSAYAVQSAMEMDDKYRIRLFNKKKLFLRDIYYQGLENTKQYMTEQRRLNVVGIESFTNDGYFTSASLAGEYDIDVDYGPYLPVDPAARKSQLLEFIKSGFYEKAGGNMRKAASLLIDGSMLDVKQDFEQSNKRQQSEIDKMIEGTKVVIQPWDDDEMHAAVVEEYARTETFETLPDQIKQTIWSHGEEHVKRIAEKIAKGQQKPPGAPGAPAAPGKPGQPPMGAEPAGKPAQPPPNTPPTPLAQAGGPII